MASDEFIKEVEMTETSILKVPFERISRIYRSRQLLLETEAKRAIESLDEIRQSGGDLGTKRAAVSSITSQIKDFRVKMVALFDEEEFVLEQCKARIAHLDEGLKTNGSQQWKEVRLDRLIVDFLVREGLYQTATQFANNTLYSHLFNVDMFAHAKEIETALQQHNAEPALLWCLENKQRLTKLKSSFEFKLRLQQFIEVIRGGDKLTAISYASRYFSEFSEHVADIRSAMMLLLYANQPKLLKYQALLSENRWDELIQQFRRNNLALNGMGSSSPLSLMLQTGISVLKTRACQKSNPSHNCPVCQDDVFDLSERLPYCMLTNSKLVCGISGAVMNDENPPMMLPNGSIYSLNALEEMQVRIGSIVCPRTGEVFDSSQLQKVFVA